MNGMQPLYAFALIVVVVAIGNMIAVKTKSIISMLFSISVFFLIAFWVGLPTTIFQDSTLKAFGTMMIPVLLAHIGTMMNIKELLAQWRTVAVAVFAVLGIAAFVIGIGQFVVGIDVAMVSSAPIAGGVIAGIQMGEAATAIGMPELALLASLLVVIQSFVGYPIASFALKKEAEKLRKQYLSGEHSIDQVEHTKRKTPLSRFQLSEAYRSEDWYLAKVALVASVAMGVSLGVKAVLGFNLLDTNILALVFGVIAGEIGFLEHSPLNRANSFGISMIALTTVIISSLSQATPEVMGRMLPLVVITLVLGTIGICVFSVVMGKLLKISPWLAVGIGISALIGFPGTFVVSNEVAHAVGQNAQEVEVITKAIQPKMITAGFITVSISSVVLAGILAPILVSLYQ